MKNTYITTISIVAMLIFMSGVAMAAVWTDQLDYSPGSIVTISGNNSDGIGYLPGETVNVSVNGPGSYDSKCSAAVDSSSAWSCQVTLASDLSAEGIYTYTAVGQTSGVTQSGTFTDAPPISTTLSKPTISPASISLGDSVNIAGTLTVGSGSLSGHTIRLQVSFNGGAFTNPATTTTDSLGSYSFSYTPASAGSYVFRTRLVPGDTGNGGYNEANSISSDALTVISNVPPSVSADSASVTVNEGQIASNTGTYSDANSGDNVQITASIGAISKTGTNSGTWSWSYTTTDGPSQSQTVTITANDGNGGTSTTSFNLNVNNVVPTVTINGAPVSIPEGTPISLSNTVNDPSTADTVAGFTYSWTVTKNGNPFLLGSSPTLSFVDDDGNFVVSLSVTDKDGGIGTDSKTITVTNVAPTIDLSGNVNVNEGSPYSLNLGTVTDPGSDTVSSYTINWGDGSSDTFSGSPSGQNKVHTYADGPNSYTIKVDLTDEDGTFASAGSKAITIDNVAPTLTIAGDASVDEGSLYTLSLSSSDPGTDTITSWNINWGDGNTETISDNPSSATHTYADGPNTYTISANATDEDGTFNANTVSVQVNNVPPTISSVTNNGPINEGSGATITVSASDPAGVNDPLSYEFDCNNDGTYETGPQAVNSATCSFGDNGNFNVKVKVSDGDGGEDTDSTTVVVNNVVPIVDVGSDATINEGSTFSQSGSFTDPGTDTWSATVDYGDGSGEQSLAFVDKTFSLSHAYIDNGNYPVTVKVTDDDGGVGTDTLNVKVNNVVPVVTAPGNQIATQGISKSFDLGSFSDPGVNDNPWAVDVDWGDSSAHATFNMPAQGTITAQSHTYSSIGTYTATVKVTDKDGGSDSKTFNVDVNYNFAGFFQPVDNNGVWNVVKAGSAIPVKLSLSGNQGLDIISSGYPISKKVTYNGGSLDDVETTLTAGSSSLTYDPATDQYIYVWKTDKTWTGTYRQLVIILKDGTEHMANFKFK